MRFAADKPAPSQRKKLTVPRLSPHFTGVDFIGPYSSTAYLLADCSRLQFGMSLKRRVTNEAHAFSNTRGRWFKCPLWVISGQTIAAQNPALSAWRELDLAHAENLTAPGSAQLHLAIRWPESQKRAKNFYRLKKHWKLAVPRVVPQPIDFNNLQCQTSLTALTGAKGIFLRCQTGTIKTPCDASAAQSAY
jgi:hypothetical protein